MVFTTSDTRRLYDEGRLFMRLATSVSGVEYPVGSQIPKGLPLNNVAALLNAGRVMTDERMLALGIKPPSAPKAPVLARGVPEAISPPNFLRPKATK